MKTGIKAAVIVGFALLLAACPGSGQAPVQDNNPTFMGKPIIQITPDQGVRLDDGLIIKGDERLVQAIRSGGIADVRVMERFPPVFVVTFPDGTVTRYHSERAKP
ncbi:MAG: hypothetical protein HQ481_18935 [Alphaproteobacteria bacterium]|nr:hypothetical protein [Alphaproteobacteria bacterium]